MSRFTQRIRRAWQRIRTEPRLGRHTAVVTSLAVLAAVAGGVILSNERISWPWNSSRTVYATLASSPGISPGHGQEVRIAGVPVGTVTAVSVTGRGQARLTLSIDPHYQVYRNATLVLRPKSQLNEMYVEMNPGGPPSARLPSGGTLPVTAAQSPVELDQVLDHLDSNAREALTELLEQSDIALADAPHDLTNGLAASDVVAQHLQPVVGALATRRAKLQELVTALSVISKSIGGNDERLTSLINSLDQTLAALGGHKGDLEASLAQLPGVTSQLSNATSAVQSLGTQLNPTLDNLKSASGSLPTALSKLRGTVDQAGTVISAGTPVVKGAVPVVHDLRPLAGDVNAALPDVGSVTSDLKPDTAYLVPTLTDLGAFIINTRSVTDLRDGNGGILRGFVVLAPSMAAGVPSGSLSTPTQPYRFQQ